MSHERGEHVQVSVRVPTELVTKLEQVAARADRTLSGELRRAIREHVRSTCEPPSPQIGEAA